MSRGLSTAVLSRALTLAGVVVLIGCLPWLTGNDPALALLRARSAEQEATPEALAAIRRDLGLDDGPLTILGRWLLGLAQGDAGTSWVSGRPVLPGTLDALGVSATLLCFAVVVAVVVAAALCLPTLARGLRGEDARTSGLFAVLLTALPEFLLAAALLVVGAVWLRWFPPYGWQGISYAVLPALALGLPAGGLLGRLFADGLATAFAEPWAQPHVAIAPVLGVGPVRLMLQHVLPSVVGPVFRHAMLRLPGIALALASLGFLGLGPQPPRPEWGLVLAEGMPYVERAPWAVLVPAAALAALSVLAVSCANLSLGRRAPHAADRIAGVPTPAVR